MNRDITQILTDIKLKYGTDVNNTCTAEDLDTVITLDTPLIVEDNVFNGRTISLGFTQTIEPEPLEAPFTEFLSVFTGTIVSHVGTTVTLSGSIDTSVLIEPTGLMLFNIVISKDTIIENDCNTGIAKMASANPNILTNYDFPTFQDCFNKYDEFCEVLIQFTDSYQNPDSINTYMVQWNLTLDIEPDTLITSIEIQDYVQDLNTISLEFGIVQDENELYFKRLKKLLSKFKVVQSKIAQDDWEGMYNTKLSLDKSDMDSYYDYYLNNGSNNYAEYKISLLFNIKIV